MSLKHLLWISLLGCSLITAAEARTKPSDLPDKHPAVKRSYAAKRLVNLNRADATQIAAQHFKGLGKKRALAIVAYRQQHGRFKTLDDLAKVRGMTKRFIDKNRQQLANVFTVA